VSKDDLPFEAIAKAIEDEEVLEVDSEYYLLSVAWL
jgi:hypothetical protein